MALQVDVGTVEVTDESVRLAEAHARQLEGEERRQILDHRHRFSEISYGIMHAWVGFLIVLTMAQFTLKGLGLGMGLDKAEFIAVITTTTASVFGFGLLVGNFLFPKGGSARRRS